MPNPAEPKVLIGGGYVQFTDVNGHWLVHPDNGMWSLTGPPEAPTVNPSVCHTWNDPEDRPQRDHYFIRDGRVEYCGDCTHGYAGKTVDLLPVSQWHDVERRGHAEPG